MDPNNNDNDNNNDPPIAISIIPNPQGNYFMKTDFLGKCGFDLRKNGATRLSLFTNDDTQIQTTLERKILCILGFYQLTIKGFETGLNYDFLRQKTYYDEKGDLQDEFERSFYELVGDTGDSHRWFTVTNRRLKKSFQIVKLTDAGKTQFRSEANQLFSEWFPSNYTGPWEGAVASDENNFSNQIYRISEPPTTNAELCHRLCAFYCKNPRSQKTLIFLYNNPGYQEGAIIRSHGWHEEPAANTVAEAGNIQDRRQRQNSYLKGLGDTHHVTDKYTYNAGADFRLRIKKEFWIEVPTGFGYENGMP